MRDGILQVIAILTSTKEKPKRSMVARYYIIEKLTTILEGGTLDLDEGNQKIYEDLKKKYYTITEDL